MSINLHPALDFLHQLRQNNNRDWFEANRGLYEEGRGAFETLISELLNHLRGPDDLGETSLKQCLFRLNRDVRFSKDKSPYKTNFAAVIANGGRKSTGKGLYVSIEPGQSILGAGIFPESSEKLARVRGRIAQNPDPLLNLATNDRFQALFGAMQGDALKNIPKGYPADHPAAAFLKHKHFIFSHSLTDVQLLRQDLVDYILQTWEVLRPVSQYLADLASD